MTTNEELCTDKEHSLLLKETGLMEGVEADDYWHSRHGKKFHLLSEGSFTKKEQGAIIKNERLIIIPTYRLDKILAKLPEWIDAGYDRNSSTCELGDQWHEAMHQIELKSGQEMYWKVENILFDLFTNRGQAAANAAAKLLHLLWKEGVE